MDKQQFNSMLQFQGGKPLVMLKEGDNGRLYVYRNGGKVGVIIPDPSGDEDSAILVTLFESTLWVDQEWHGSYAAIAAGLSDLQQSGGDWCIALKGFEEFKAMQGEPDEVEDEVPFDSHGAAYNLNYGIGNLVSVIVNREVWCALNNMPEKDALALLDVLGKRVVQSTGSYLWKFSMYDVEVEVLKRANVEDEEFFVDTQVETYA